MRIAVRTSKYFIHFKRENGITNAIMNFLEKEFGITIDYDEDAEVATITDEKNVNFIFSGKIAQILENEARFDGFSEEDIRNETKMQTYVHQALKEAMILHKMYYQTDKESDCIYVKDNKGNVIHIISPISNFGVEWERQNELREYVKEFLTEE